MKRTYSRVILILVILSLCGSTQAFGIPQSVSLITPGVAAGVNSGTISFAGGDSPLVGSINFDAWSFFYIQKQGITIDSIFLQSWSNLLSDLTLSFETGPRVGSGYDFSCGAVYGSALNGILSNVHVFDGGGLVADFEGSIAYGWAPGSCPGGFGRGILEIGFNGVTGIAPEPFTTTEVVSVFANVVPLPASGFLLGSGLLGLAGLRWRRMRQS